MDRKMITVSEQLNLDGMLLTDVIKLLNQKVDEYGKETRLNVETVYEHGDTYAQSFVSYKREENDSEYKVRVARVKATEEVQRRQYEELKKKFG